MAITNKDVDKLKEVFATKEDLERFATKEDLERFETRNDAAKKHNEIMTTLDKLMKEKETAGQERILASGKDREQDREISGLKERVGKIEVKIG